MRLTGSRTYYRSSPPKMPPGLVELMEGLTKEVLKQNPSNIYEFCANHVQQLIEKRDGPPHKKLLSLEEKIAKAQNKVRQRAEMRKQEFDKEIFLLDHDETQSNNIASNDEISVSSLLSVPQSIVIDKFDKVNFKSNNNTLHLYPRDKMPKNVLKAPIHRDNVLEKSSEVEVCHESECDVNSTLSKIEGEMDLTVNIDIPDCKTDSEIKNNLHERPLGRTVLADDEVSIFIPAEQQTEFIVDDELGTEEVYVTQKERSVSSMAPIQDIDQSTRYGDKKVEVTETATVVKDVVDEISTLHVTDTAKSNTAIENSNHDGDIRDTLNIQIEQKEKSKDGNEDIYDKTCDNNIEIIESNQQTDQIIREVDNKTATHEEDNANVDKVVSESLATKKSHCYQSPAVEDYSSERAVSKETELTNNSFNDLPVVKASTTSVEEPDSNIEKAVKDAHLYLESREPYIVMKVNTTDNELEYTFDSKVVILDNDIPTLTPGNTTNHVIQGTDSITAPSAINEDKGPYGDPVDNLSMDPVEISSERDLNIGTLDTYQNSENSSTDLLLNSSSVPVHMSEEVNYDNIEMKSSLSVNDNSERDNLHSTSMDLETAAITIQKVFRSFLFKSRGSTLEDSVNDETIFLEEDINKEVCDFPVENAINIDRRTHGITRIDTVLQTVNEEKSLSLSTDDSSTLSSAATIIQAHVRGFLVRNKLNLNKKNSSLAASNSNEPTITSLDGVNDQQSKTVLNIHIVSESGDYLSRDESLITSMDLSLDSPSSTNLDPSNDKSERRKRLKREDAIQSVSPPSNNSGKLSEDIDSVKEIVADNFVNDSNSIKTNLCNTEQNKNISKEECSLQTAEMNENNIEGTTHNIDKELKLNEKSLTKMNSDERDVVTPLTSSDDSGLIHSGEFHDAVVPTKVSRSDTSVVSGE